MTVDPPVDFGNVAWTCVESLGEVRDSSSCTVDVDSYDDDSHEHVPVVWTAYHCFNYPCYDFCTDASDESTSCGSTGVSRDL